MYRLLIGPVIIGILAFLSVYFISPFIISAADMVAIFAQFALGMSNAIFDNMPPVIASYIANLNLLKVAITAALFLTVVVQLLVITGGLFICVMRWLISCLQRKKKEKEPQDLPPIDMKSGFKSTQDGKKVMGRGLDSIDRD